ncbi:MAG: alpha/beta hydrolase [Solirubrobacterales bacterium]|nr:alpha/beta hydrolase [Solirubrobacterales bacterium]
MLALTPLPPIWREGRAPLEFAELIRDPVWQGTGVPRGDGRPVLLICGFLAGDPSLSSMAAWLTRIGYKPARAGLRWNVGCLGETVDRLEERAEELSEEAGRKISLVGQSRGGTCAKALAVRRRDLIEAVITLGSPLRDQLDIHPGVWAHVHLVGVLGTLGVPGLFSVRCRNGECCTQANAEVASALPEEVKLTSVYSRSDGIVRWRSCLDDDATQVEVAASHIGMAANAQTYRAIARALARTA